MSLIPADAKKAIELFLMQGEEPSDSGLAVSAPEASAYEFQSHTVIDMLEKLLDKFVDERTATEKKEMNTKHAFDMLMQDLKAQIEQATQDRGEKAGVKAKKLQAKADAEGDLTDTTTTRDSDQKYLSNLVATCEQKASDFESRQQLRAEELQAITKAIEIISSSAVSGNAGKYLPKLLQNNATALGQLLSSSHSPTQARVAEYLHEKGQHLNSRVLSTLAV